MADPVDALAGQLAGMGIADPPAAVRDADAAVVAFVRAGRRPSFAAAAAKVAADRTAAAAAAANEAERDAREAAAAAVGLAGNAVTVIKKVWGTVSSAGIAVSNAAASASAHAFAAALETPGHVVTLLAKIAAGGGTMVFAGAVIADLSHGENSGILMYANECLAQIAGSAEDPDVRAWVLAVLIHEMATKSAVSTALLARLKDLFTPGADGGRRRKRRGGGDKEIIDCMATAIAVGMYVGKNKEFDFAKEGSATGDDEEGDPGTYATPPRGGRRTRRHRRHRPSAPTRKGRRTSYGGRKHYTRPRRG